MRGPRRTGGFSMKLSELVKALEALDPEAGQPVDAVGHTYSADLKDSRCTRCGVGVPTRRQYTAIECAGRASTLDEYAARKTATEPVAPKTETVSTPRKA